MIKSNMHDKKKRTEARFFYHKKENCSAEMAGNRTGNIRRSLDVFNNRKDAGQIGDILVVH